MLLSDASFAKMSASILASDDRLLFLFGVHRVLTQTRAVLFNFQLFASGFAAERVVVVARFVADEVNDFKFLF